MAARKLAALILAAGKGTRLKSRRPKVLHGVGGRPMLSFVLDAALALGAARRLVVVGRRLLGCLLLAALARGAARRRVVVGFGAEPVEERVPGRAEFGIQAPQRGTGHAVSFRREPLGSFDGDVGILYGDTPLLRG